MKKQETRSKGTLLIPAVIWTAVSLIWIVNIAVNVYYNGENYGTGQSVLHLIVVILSLLTAGIHWRRFIQANQEEY